MVTKKCRLFRLITLVCFATASVVAADLRIGIIGLDTSHVTAFTKALNNPNDPGYIPGGKVVGAYKGGSFDMIPSISRVEGYTEEMTKTYGIKLYPTMEELAEDVDAIMICSVDGRTHLDAARKVLPYRKPVFVDKPMTDNLQDAIEIFRLGKQYGTPVFSSSALRFTPDIIKVKETDVGRLHGVSLFGPGPRERTVPDLFFYGIHSVEKAYTLMGPGCITVVRTHTANTDVTTGVWSDGRVATVRTFATLFDTPVKRRTQPSTQPSGKARYLFGVLKFGSLGVAEAPPEPHTGYHELLLEIMKFFQTGVSPVSPTETIEVIAFMQASDLSKDRGGVPVSVPDLIRDNGGLGL